MTRWRCKAERASRDACCTPHSCTLLQRTVYSEHGAITALCPLGRGEWMMAGYKNGVLGCPPWLPPLAAGPSCIACLLWSQALTQLLQAH